MKVGPPQNCLTPGAAQFDSVGFQSKVTHRGHLGVLTSLKAQTSGDYRLAIDSVLFVRLVPRCNEGSREQGLRGHLLQASVTADLDLDLDVI